MASGLSSAVRSVRSLTSVSCKILENIICKHMMTDEPFSDFEKYNVLTPLSHGFRSGFSCETQLLTTANDFLKVKFFDNNKQVDVCLCVCVCVRERVHHYMHLQAKLSRV